MAKKTNYEKYLSEYERGLLALAYRHCDLLTELRQLVTSDYFLYPPHKIIYSALCSLVGNDMVSKIDLDCLVIECEKLGLKKYLPNMDYLAILTQGGQDKENFRFYFDKVKNAYLKYELYQIIERSSSLIEKNATDETENKRGDELVNLIATEISKLNTFNGLDANGIKFSEVVRDFVLERARNPQPIMGLTTGFNSLDTAINGLLPGTLTVIAGEAKAGKSTVIMNMANHIAIDAESPVPVLVISTEMSSEEDLSRQIAMRSLIEERKIINGIAYNDPKLKPVLDKVIDEIENAKIYHEYTPDFNATKICNIIHYYKLKYDIGVAIFDYIKMETENTGEASAIKYKREDQILGDITTALKNTAGKLRIPVITACQINTRTGRIADSDRILRYANTLLEFRPKQMEELGNQDYHRYGTHWLQVYRSRAGGNCRIPIRFWRKCLKLQEAEVFQGQEDEVVDHTRDLLTTPDEWSRLREEALTIDYVNNIAKEQDGYDLEKSLDSDDTTNNE